jgi:hypothetical protein
VTLVVTGITFSCRVVWRRRMSVIEWLRWLLIGNRWDIRWLSGRGKGPTLCVFRVFRVAVMEKCCDACGYGKYYFRSSCLAQRMLVSPLHRLLLSGSPWDIRWLSGRGKTPTLCVIPIFRMVVLEKCYLARGEGGNYFRSGCLASRDASI